MNRLANTIRAVDVHACGEPGRVIVGGVSDVPGATMFEKRLYLERHSDNLRKLMLREPRGYPALCCNLILPPADPTADAGLIIMEQTEYPAMSGSNAICAATVLIETGMVKVTEPVTTLTLDTPAGLVLVRADVEGGKAKQITFRNVPAFATHLDAALTLPSYGRVVVDVAYGGMFYVIADAAQFGLTLNPHEARQVLKIGEMLKAAAREQLEVAHPENPGLGGVSISQLSAPPTHALAHRKNAVVVSAGVFDGERPETWSASLDRSPCGTGTSAKMAVMHAKGELPLDREFVHESMLGTLFTGKLIEETRVGQYAAVVPEITGSAWITGYADYVLDPSDPFPEGFMLGDLWPVERGRSESRERKETA
ncbi:MAG: proline racemase [Acidobacteriaceae bacterium]|jgi:proline racemase|nr:proline racemase [Acidobacteriaceae bacterium]